MTVDNLAALGARDDLLWIVDHWNQLRARLHPSSNNALTGMPTGSDNPAPIDLHISDLMHEITQAARYYGQILLDETLPTHGCGNDDTNAGHPAQTCPNRVDPITTSEMPGLLHDIARRYGHFTNDPTHALAFCDTAADYRDKVHRTIERPAPPTYVGPCQHRGPDGSGCTGELYVREGRHEGTCRECGEPFTLIEQREWLETQMQDRLMTPSELVSALLVLGHKVPIGTVKSWISRSRLVAVGDGLYRLADARDLAERRRVA